MLKASAEKISGIVSNISTYEKEIEQAKKQTAMEKKLADVQKEKATKATKELEGIQKDIDEENFVLAKAKANKALSIHEGFTKANQWLEKIKKAEAETATPELFN